jgi:hypothetical protein
MIPSGQLDELVWQDLCEILTHPEMLQQALERAHGGHWLPQELQARRETLRKARVHLATQLERLTEAYLGAVIALPEYERRRTELQRKIDALAGQDQQLDRQTDQQAQLSAIASSMTEFCQRVQAGLACATFEHKRQLVELLIDRVIVTNGDVEIRYVIPTSKSGEHTRFCHLRLDYLTAKSARIFSCHLGRIVPTVGDQIPHFPFALVIPDSTHAHPLPAGTALAIPNMSQIASPGVGHERQVLQLLPLAVDQDFGAGLGSHHIFHAKIAQHIT